MKVVKPIQFNALSFERDSEATYYNSSGILTTAAVDVLRYGYNPSTMDYIGPIFESEQTNYITRSNNFIHAEWIKSSSPTLTANAGVSPDGTTNATLFANDGSLSMGFSSQTKVAFSVYFKPQSPPAYPSDAATIELASSGDLSGFITFTCYSDHAPLVAASSGVAVSSDSIQLLQNGWYRGTIYRSGTTSLVAINDNVGAFFIYGAQAEKITGTFFRPSSYIISNSGSATVRAADIQNDPPSVVSSNIPELDYDEWDDSTPYAADDLVTVLGSYNRNYRAINAILSLPAQPPYIDITNWIDMGATNRWRMFDMRVGADLQSSHADLVDVTVALSEQIDSVALFNMYGSLARVTMYSGDDVIYESEVDLISPPTASQWWSYWFDRRRQVKDAVFLNLPPSSSSSIRIQVFGSGNTAIGKAVIGYSFDIGFAEYGTTSMGITDYSTKEADTFGNSFVQERRYVGKVSIKTVIDPGNEIFVRDSLAEVRAISSAYITRYYK